MPAEALAFLYGKMPAHGDFVSRGLDSDARGRWDEWLAREMSAARTAHGDAFEHLYTHAPVWRFAIAEGDERAAGALACSVDAVGRLFPLVAGRFDTGASEALIEACEDRLYDAFADGWSADRLHDELAALAAGGAPADPHWWTPGNDDFAPARLDGVRPARLIASMLTPGGAA